MKNNLYIVSCANWRTVAEGKDAEDASTKAFEAMMKIKGKDLQVSAVIQTLCLSDIMEDFDLEQYVDICSCPKVMSNAGYHDSAKMLTEIIEK